MLKIDATKWEDDKAPQLTLTMSYRREISPGVTSPTDIPAEADGPYLLEVLRNPRKKTLIQTPAYKRYRPNRRTRAQKAFFKTRATKQMRRHLPQGTRHHVQNSRTAAQFGPTSFLPPPTQPSHHYPGRVQGDQLRLRAFHHAFLSEESTTPGNRNSKTNCAELGF